MTAQQTGSMLRRVVPAAMAAVALVAFAYWFLACPCDRIPGGYLVGSQVDAPVDDWTFANGVTLCQIQIRAGILPHSLNLNCMSTPAGELYLSCSQCSTKRWSNAVLEDGTARLRLDGAVYPVTLTRILDPDELDRAWLARVTKLNALTAPGSPPPPSGTPRPDHWWTFRVVSRT